MNTARTKGAKGRADRAFSRLVRLRGKCERCGKRNGTLQCAHIISRRYSATRTMLNNAWCLCAGCHLLVDTHAGLKMELVEQTISEPAYWTLYRLAQQGAKVDWDAEAKRLTERLKELEAA